jgi:hypothetical protein
MAIGRLSPSTAVWMTSGEATPSAKLPEQFKSTPVAVSPISSQLSVPPDWMPDTRRAPIVSRVERMNGIWHLYARGARRQPYERVGQPGGVPPRPNISSFQPNNMGPIRNGGFNNSLYQAGYPGFNLGLSFKVPSIKTMGGPRTNFNSPITISQSRSINRLRRSTGAPDAG